MSSKMSNSKATIAFTLPVSCQICLGKVKQPVVCPNQHVFCGPCMELWLERNQQCPACRIYITEQNPCKPVLGGLNPETAPAENFCQKELRRARMELIYKDYENEIDRMEAELEAATQDNKELRIRLHGNHDSGNHSNHVMNSASPTSPGTTEQNRGTIVLLNNKLKDATALYDKVKVELDTYKQENDRLTNQNADQLRENQTLRLDLSGRSPRRFGRYTVATLEAKVESSDKQIAKLQKALERSDGYIEDIEKELEKYRNTQGCMKCAAKVKVNRIADSDLDLSKTDSNWNDSELPSRISNISEPVSDVVSDVKLEESDLSLRLPGRRTSAQSRSSFDLEVPSPLSKSSKQYNTDDSCIQETDDSFHLSKPSTSVIPEPTLDGCKKKLRFTFGDDDSSSNDLMKHIYAHKDHGTGSTSKGKVRFSMDVLAKDTQGTEDMNVSITPDMEDCFRYMDEAKRKLEERKLPTTAPVTGFSGIGFQASTGLSSKPHALFPKHTQTVTSFPPAAATESNFTAADSHRSFASSLPIPERAFTGQYPRMHSLSDNLNLGTAPHLGSSGLGTSHKSHIDQSAARSQAALLQNNQSNAASHMRTFSNSVSHHTPNFYGSTASTSIPNHSSVATVSSLQPHSLGGSTLSQPVPSVHHNIGIFNSGTVDSNTATMPRFPHFPISQ